MTLKTKFGLIYMQITDSFLMLKSIIRHMGAGLFE